MKNSNGKSFLVVIAFLAISLLAANAFILNADPNVNFEPHIVKTILKNQKIENTQSKIGDEDADNDEVDKDLETLEEDAERKDELSKKATSASVATVEKGSSGKVLIEQSTKRVLFEQNARKKCYPASTTKVLTAYVVLKNLPLDHIVTVPKQAAGVEGSSIYLKEGDQATVEDLLYGLMLRSGNDAATALAIEVAGSVEAFADMMNKEAQALGATDSHFVNPHGLHDDAHYTTAYDLALITAAAYELDDFRKIVSTTIRRIEIDGETTVIGNKNKLLKMYDGANGVKTGYTKKSGRCLVGGAKRDDMQLISVVLNCPDMWNDTKKMFDFGFENFRMVPLDSALLTYGEGKKRVEVVAPYSVTSDWQDIFYPLGKDEYLEVRAA